MAGDDLDAPLGYRSGSDGDSSKPTRDVPWGAVALGGMGLIAISLVAFVAVTESRKASMAQSIAIIDPVTPRKIAAPDLPQQSAASREEDQVTQVARAARAAGSQVEVESGVRVIRRGAPDMPESMIIRVPQEELKTSLAPAPDDRLIGPGPHGPLPRIGRDGARPADIYARPVVVSARLPQNAPRIALVITGMGVSDEATQHAISALPPAVTLAFAAHGERVRQHVEAARNDGHELLLQVPMEGFGAAATGVRILPSQAPREKIVDALHWHMSRFPGYIGVTHFLGGRFMSAQPAMSAVLQDMAERGLVFLDDGSIAQSVAPAVAAATGTSLARADIVIDAQVKPEAVDAALRRLETLARERGIGIGTASALPSSVDRVARFAQGLEARGIALVPLSALINAPARTSQR